LAPTFGKAHARLGQSLYFLKDYEGAVNAYEEAVKYEPENQVTVTYLEKAKSKLARQHDRARRQAKGDEVSVAEESVTMTVTNSIATDPHAAAAVVTTRAPYDQQLMVAAGRLPNEVNLGSTSLVTSPLAEEGEQNWEGQEDPDFDAAVRIQESANKLLASKNYKDAIQEYSSALFLVPDDPYLSPELHLGRAHALNGSHRHESARNDALLAIKINPSSEAYSTLAKSLFYMKDYLGAVAAFEDCMDLLPQGESLSMFDQAYLRKAEAAWQEQLDDNSFDLRSLASTSTKSTTIPKLPPPRFVPREKVRPYVIFCR
jgi:tetratricopeptide (TPR) repeat protein